MITFNKPALQWACLIICVFAHICSYAQLNIDQGEGKELKSPDGRWNVLSLPPTTTDRNATLVLETKTGTRIKLLSYFRSGTLTWAPNSKYLIFVDRHSPEDSRLSLFEIDKRGKPTPKPAAEKRLREEISRRISNLDEILFYDIEISKCEDSACVLQARVTTARKNINSGPAREWVGEYRISLSNAGVTCLKWGQSQ